MVYLYVVSWCDKYLEHAFTCLGNFPMTTRVVWRSLWRLQQIGVSRL